MLKTAGQYWEEKQDVRIDELRSLIFWDFILVPPRKLVKGSVLNFLNALVALHFKF